MNFPCLALLAPILLVTIVSAGCVGEDPAHREASSSRAVLVGTSAANATLVGTTVAAAPAVQDWAAVPENDPLKVAFAYGAPLGESGAGFAHDRGRREMQAMLGGKVSTSFIEGRTAGDGAEQALRDLAGQGNRIIFGATIADRRLMLRLAREFPDVKWEGAGSGFDGASNLRSYDVRTYQGAYLAGIVAGKMTRTDTLGFIGSVPVPEVIRSINAYTLGAQSVNPSVRTKVAWVHKWFDPGREAEAAQSLISAGADVLLQSTDSTAPLQVAEKAGKYAFGWNSDMKSYGPKAHLGSSVVSWAPYYTRAVQQALDGTWRAQGHWWGIKEGAVDLVSLSDSVPAEVKVVVDGKKRAIGDGTFTVWKGPMISSDDIEVLATGEVGDERFVRGMMFYVKGVDGKVPPPG